MRAAIRPFVTAFSIACLPILMAAAPVGAAFAQNAQPDAAQAPVKQIALTEKQIEGALAAKADIDPIVSKLPEGANDKPDPKALAQLDGAVKKHGFANYAEYEDVDDNINLVMGGIDPQTKKYVGDEIVLKKEIAEMQADKKMAPKDKKEALDQMNDALKSITPLQFPANIPLVVKYYDKLSEESPQNQ
ncbi:hypothetical protein [Methylocapsa sp. S129]|uniref:hypothetical protein n=1 Tax=Methylocapsa sp. S129 TaxID=1641869 RepID=UPI00131BB629|nr:hypothetical protein [Methylocapsa sp. S129]